MISINEMVIREMTFIIPIKMENQPEPSQTAPSQPKIDRPKQNALIEILRVPYKASSDIPGLLST